MKRKTEKMPVIHKTKSGKKYFLVHGERVYIEAKMSKKDIMGVYKLLKKKIKPQKKATQINTNTAKAVVNITNPPRRRYVNRKVFQSGLNDLNRVVVSHGNESANNDLLNSLMNGQNKNKELLDKLLKQQNQKQINPGTSTPGLEPPKSQNSLDYSEINRISGMLKDERLPDIFQRNFPYDQTKLLLEDYALGHLLHQNKPKQVDKQPINVNQNLPQDPKTYDQKSPSEKSMSSIDEPEGIDIGSYDLPTRGRNPDVLDKQNILKELQKQQEELQRQNEELEQEKSIIHERMVNTPDDDDQQYGELQKKIRCFERTTGITTNTTKTICIILPSWIGRTRSVPCSSSNT